MGLLTDAVSARNTARFTDLLQSNYEFDSRINTEQDKNGDCALIIAAKLGYTEMIEPLLAAEASVNQSNRYGITALHAAAEQNHLEVLQILIQHPGVVVNKLDNLKRTPLYLSVQKGFFEASKLLIEAKSRVNQKGQDEETLLNMAAAQGNEKLVGLLIQSGAVVNEEGGQPRLAPLHHGVLAKAPLVVQLLLKANAYSEITDDKGRTPLHIAAETNAVEVAQVLLDGGANARAVTGSDENRNGKTALDLAKQHKHEGMVTLLREHLRAHPQTTEQAQLLTGSDSEHALHIDLHALSLELASGSLGLFGGMPMNSAEGQDPQQTNVQTMPVWNETLSSTGAFLQGQSAGLGAQGNLRSQPGAAGLLNLFSGMGGLMQGASGRGAPLPGSGLRQQGGVFPTQGVNPLMRPK